MTHEKGTDPEWSTSYTPFSVDLYDVVQTANGPYAVGGGGTVARKHEGNWEALIQSGPSGQGSVLRTIAVTDEGNRVWFAGASGALGMYDLRKGEKQDYSYSGDATTSWQEIAVSGKAGEERALLANGSGAVVSFAVEGTELSFSEPTEPGQGDTVTALETTSDGVGYAVDDAGKAYRANPEGWSSLGTVNAGTTLTDIYADSTGRILVSATDGQLYKYERAEESWTPIQVARSALLSVDVFQGHVVVLATGATFFTRPVTGNRSWQRTEARTGNNLVALALGYPDVAVGKSGTVVERPRGEQKRGTGSEESPPTEPPVDPCTVLTEEMVERLGTHALLELVEEHGCTSAFTETVSERLELRHLAERHVHLGKPPHELSVELVQRIRRSDRYVLRCALCDERILCRRRPECPPSKVEKGTKKNEQKEEKKQTREGACTCGRWPRCGCAKPPEEPEAALCGVNCEHCGHAEFYVSRFEQNHRHVDCCDGHHEHHGGCDCGGHHEHEHGHHGGCDCGTHHETHEHHCDCGGHHEHGHCDCRGHHAKHGHHEHHDGFDWRGHDDCC